MLSICGVGSGEVGGGRFIACVGLFVELRRAGSDAVGDRGGG